MIDIPKDIEKYLVKDEIVDNQFGLKEQTVYASKNRLFLTKGNRVKDINYNHISSVELETKPNWSRVVFGILVIAAIFLPGDESTPWGRFFMSYGAFSTFLTLGTLLLGIFLIIAGFKWKNHYIKLNVAGISERLVLEGNKGDIASLFRLINERRF